ncbi:MAG: hypothetical protein IJL52_03170 [Clostridia bacterium]|nr:hypothetical protein [Clostridia bacterium]
MSAYTFYQVLKTLLAWVYLISSAFSPAVGGGDFAPSQPAAPGDASMYIRADAVDTGIDIYTPRVEGGGYRYGPSMILNTDGSLDVWCATDGPGDISDMISYQRLYDGGKRSSAEKLALKPTGGGWDDLSTCDPGVIKFGGYYYIGYTTTLDNRGVDNDICVARSKSPDGPYEKWTGSGWGAEPAPLIEYTGNPDYWGAGEPSFVLMGDRLYIYYSWNQNEPATRLAIADATDENWPATLEYKGDVIPEKNGGADSTDVKYVDAFGRFIAVFTDKRFSSDSFISVWESFDGVNFRQSDIIKTNTAQYLHNCGISGRADGHIGAGDPVYLGYAYGEWGPVGWATRLHQITLSLSDAPQTDDAGEKNIEMPITSRPVSAVPDILTVKAEKQTYTISRSQQVWILAYDNDGYIFPVLAGTRFYGYDRSVIRIVGGRMFPVGEGSTRVFFNWNGMRGDFLVKVVK